MKVWFCKIGTTCKVDLLSGADIPMRDAVKQAFRDVTGLDAEFCFSGWNAELDEAELNVIRKKQ